MATLWVLVIVANGKGDWTLLWAQNNNLHSFSIRFSALPRRAINTARRAYVGVRGGAPRPAEGAVWVAAWLAA